jgi:hypothetical protein
MLLYTKNAINVFSVALIAPVEPADGKVDGFGDNPFRALNKMLIKQMDGIFSWLRTTLDLASARQPDRVLSR